MKRITATLLMFPIVIVASVILIWKLADTASDEWIVKISEKS